MTMLMTLIAMFRLFDHSDGFYSLPHILGTFRIKISLENLSQSDILLKVKFDDVFTFRSFRAKN